MIHMFKKIFSYLIVVVEIVALNLFPFYAEAWSPADFIDPISLGIHKSIDDNLIPKILEIGEERYHMDQSTMQEYGEGMNVSTLKGAAPEVMLSFSPSDPKIGEKITAHATPMYFSTPTESLYYTWYLRHEGCNLDDHPNDYEEKKCDKDGDGEITVEDWKIEAMQIIANGGFQIEKADYFTAINDNDGYKSHMGGDSNVRPATNYHCYIHDFKNGENYEIINAVSETSNNFYTSTAVCSEANVKCVKDDTLLCSPTFSTSSVASTEYQICKEALDSPFCDPGSCVGDNCTVVCPTGFSARCVSSSDLDPNCDTITEDAPCLSLGSAISYCTTNTITNNDFNEGRECQHLFPDAPGYETGDGLFPRGEEQFWGTNPNDPDTADNGNKDEANVAGLGVNSFTWNYDSGDRVGVIVEGESMMPTKHDDSSMMIMWALPNNDCEIEDENKSSYIKEIKGYDVEIPIAAVDIDACLKNNLVDPREGGQPKNLEVSLSYYPENPINDPTDDNMGDRVSVQSIISNASQSSNNIYYAWEVKISKDGIFSLNEEDWVDIVTSNEEEFLTKGENISLTEGINVSSLDFDLNFDRDDLIPYISGGVGYLRVYLKVEESFDRGETRSGNSDIIIKFTSSDKKIVPHKVIIDENDKLSLGSAICQDNLMEKSICFVVKNEIIGLDVNDSNLNNFSWTLNGQPLFCDSSISDNCQNDKQSEINFFPVSGDPGDTYTVTLDANDVSTNSNDSNLGNSIHLVKSFQVVNPSVNIISTSGNFEAKNLGNYLNLKGESFTDYSETVFQSPENSTVNLTAEFFPNFIGAEENFLGDNPITEAHWLVGDIEEGIGKNFEITMNKPIGSYYGVGLEATYEQSLAVRRILNEVWGVSQFESTENKMSDFSQIEIVENTSSSTGMVEGSQKALANLLYHFPSQAMFMLKILLTVLMIIFISSAVMSISPRRI